MLPPGQPMRSDTASQRIMHRGLHGERRRLIRLLLDDAEDGEAASPAGDTAHPSRKLANQIAGCCRHPWSLVSGDGARIGTSLGRCNQRVCPLCRAHRARETEARVHQHLRDVDSARFLTLTVRSVDKPLTEQIKDLYASFGRLRRRKAWKEHVLGGVAVVEVTWSQKLQLWHPHLHVIIDGAFWSQRWILREWEEVVGDDAGVRINKVNSRSAIAAYIAKYVAKSATPAEAPSSKMVEWCHALKGTRTLLAFGKVVKRRGRKTEVVDAAADAAAAAVNRPKWERVAHLGALLEQALAGCNRSRRLYKSWRLMAAEARRGGSAVPQEPRRLARVRRLIRRLREWADPSLKIAKEEITRKKATGKNGQQEKLFAGEPGEDARLSMTPTATA